MPAPPNRLQNLNKIIVEDCYYSDLKNIKLEEHILQQQIDRARQRLPIAKYKRPINNTTRTSSEAVICFQLPQLAKTTTSQEKRPSFGKHPNVSRAANKKAAPESESTRCIDVGQQVGKRQRQGTGVDLDGLSVKRPRHS